MIVSSLKAFSLYTAIFSFRGGNIHGGGGNKNLHFLYRCTEDCGIISYNCADYQQRVARPDSSGIGGCDV